MGNSGIGLAAGLMQGFARGRQIKMAREDKKELLALQKDAAKVAATKEKRAAAKEAFLIKLLEARMGGGATSTAAPNIGESFGSSALSSAQGKPMPSPSVTETMASSSLLESMDPETAVLLKALGGPDFLGGMRVNEQKLSRLQRTDADKRRDEDRDREYERGYEEYKIINVPDGQGGTTQVKVPKYSRGGTEGEFLGFAPPELGTIEIKKKGDTFIQPVNPVTKKPVGEPILKEKKKGMSGDVAGKYGMLQSGLNAVREVKSILMPNGVVDNKTYEMLAQASVNLPFSKGREVNALIFDALEGKIRIESGAAVPEEEIRRMAKRFKPSPLDSKELISSKLKRLEAYLTGTIELLDPNKHYANNALTISAEDGKKYVIIPAKEMPDSIRKRLKEGVKTKFGNGQVWTLRDGQPTRIE